jgi:nitroreductase
MSSNLDMLRKIPDTGYRETAPEIDSTEFEKVISSRRSVRVFEEGVRIPDEVVEKCLDAALAAPNSSNLQPWEFYWIKDEAKLKKAQEICVSQSAARTAPTIIVAVAKMNTWNRNRKMMIDFFNAQEKRTPGGAYKYYEQIAKLSYNQGFLGMFGILKKLFLFFQRLKGDIAPQPPTSYSDMRVWAHKSTALACENIMLAFRAYGYDTCPMEGLDPVAMSKLLGLDSKSEVCMAISAGKRAPNGIFSPRVRFDKELFIKVL